MKSYESEVGLAEARSGKKVPKAVTAAVLVLLGVGIYLFAKEVGSAQSKHDRAAADPAKAEPQKK